MSLSPIFTKGFVTLESHTTWLDENKGIESIVKCSCKIELPEVFWEDYDSQVKGLMECYNQLRSGDKWDYRFSLPGGGVYVYYIEKLDGKDEYDNYFTLYVSQIFPYSLEEPFYSLTSRSLNTTVYTGYLYNSSKEKFVERLNLRYFMELIGWCPDYEVSRIKWHFDLGDRGGVLLLTNGKYVVAYLYYRSLSSHEVAVEYIEVNVSLRRLGIGKRLMEKAQEYFIRRKYKSILINPVSDEGIIHSERLGFKVQKRYDYHDSLSPFYRKCKIFIRHSVLQPYQEGSGLRLVVWDDPSGSKTPAFMCEFSGEKVLPFYDHIYYDSYVGIMEGGRY